MSKRPSVSHESPQRSTICDALRESKARGETERGVTALPHVKRLDQLSTRKSPERAKKSNTNEQLAKDIRRVLRAI